MPDLYEAFDDRFRGLLASSARLETLHTGMLWGEGPVYFADGAVNMYQMRQWYAPLRELAKTWPVVVLSRNARGALAPCALNESEQSEKRIMSDAESITFLQNFGRERNE